MELHQHRRNPYGERYDGDVGSVLMFSAFLGILWVAIFTYEERGMSDTTASFVVAIIGILTCFLGLLVTTYLIVSVCYYQRAWIQCKDSCIPTVTKVNMGFLWFFGIVKCAFSLTYMVFYLRCKYAVQSELLYSLLIHSSVNIAFVLMQVIFMTCTSRYTFICSAKMKYLMSLIAIGNLVEWIRSILFRISNNKDLLLTPDENGTYQVNCSYVQSDTIRKFTKITMPFRLPVTLEFAVLATSFVFGLTERKTLPSLIKNHRDPYLSGNSGQSMSISLKSLPVFSFPKIKIFLFVVAAAFWNISTLVILPWSTIVPSPGLSDLTVGFLCSLKIFVLILILTINHNFFRKLNFVLHNKPVNFNEMALTVSTMAVIAFSVTAVLLEEKGPYLIVFRVSNSIGVLYQTIFIIMGHRFEDLGNDLDISQNTKLLILLLSSNNMTNWMVNSMVGLQDIGMAKDHFYRIIQLILYPFMTYYRFQSFTELLSLYEQIKY